MPVVTQQPGLPSTLLIQCMCLLTCLSRFVVFNQLVANRRMCIDIQQLDVQGTRLRFYIYYNVVFPLKMANSFGMSVYLSVSLSVLTVGLSIMLPAVLVSQLFRVRDEMEF